ncbi:hypothetical protein ACYTW9_27250, partial [Escherichia coli]
MNDANSLHPNGPSYLAANNSHIKGASIPPSFSPSTLAAVSTLAAGSTTAIGIPTSLILPCTALHGEDGMGEKQIASSFIRKDE